MKTFPKMLVGIALLSVALLPSCKKDEDKCNSSFNFQTELQAELNNVINAATVFANDPSTANCNAYRDAYQDYLNEAEKLQGCANEAGQGAEYQQAINEAQAELDALQC